MILVTGATGFIGRYLVSKLLESGQKVRALVRSETRSVILPKALKSLWVTYLTCHPSRMPVMELTG